MGKELFTSDPNVGGILEEGVDRQKPVFDGSFSDKFYKGKEKSQGAFD